VAGDKLFVDWAGGTVPIIDPMTGEVQETHLFARRLPDWIGAHVNAFNFLVGVPNAAVPDKS
jgi:transposase